MKPFIFILLCSFTFTHQARGTCDFNQYSGDIRLGVINDDQIYTLFTTHITPEQIDAAISAITTRNLRDRINRLNKALTRYKATIQSEQSDVQQIIGLLESQQIDWIGIEASPEDLQRTSLADLKSVYRDDRNSLNNLNFHSQWDQDKADQILYLSFPIIVIAYAQNPEIFHGIKIIPLENNEQRRKAIELKLQIKNQEDILIDFIHTGLITSSQFQTIKAFFKDRLNNVTQSNSSSEIESLLANLQEESRTTVNTYLDRSREFGLLIEERSQAMAASISQQSGNGLVIGGYSHASSIEEYLTATCQPLQIQ